MLIVIVKNIFNCSIFHKSNSLLTSLQMKQLLVFNFFLIIVSGGLHAQDFENLYKKAKYDEAKFLINKKLQQTGDSLSYHLKMAEAYERERKIDSADIYLEKIILDSLNLVQKADYYYLKARVYDQQLNQTEEALTAYTEARKRYKALGNIKQLNKIRYYLFYLLSSDTNTLETAAKNLDTLQKEAIKHEDTTGQILAALANAARNFSPDKAEIVQKYLDDAYQLSESSGNLVNQETAASYYGLHYLYNKKQPANAEIWLNESIRLSEEMDNPTALLYAYINRAVLPREQKNYRESVDWLLKAEEVLKSNTVYDLTLKGVVYENLAKDFENLKVYDSSLIYHKEYMKADTLFNYSKQNIGFMEYQLREVEKTNSLLERQKALDDELLKSTEKVKERTEKIALLLGVLLILILILGALFFKTIQRKRKIAEQEQQLEQEKVKQLVKEQELQAIDAMISGQEKERERLAGELHDNLGSLMATLKLHFENYKSQVTNPQQEKILNNTDTLLDEAYQKVRGMAHARNTGVIAKYGLLPAVESFAAKVGATRKLNIEVSHNDFTDRLENTLELSIFRMIQELITNVIKHARATEIQLQLARHDDYISILIEDNGIGFNASKLPQKQGMGLASIKKRVEVKGGSFHIDSTPGHGTTVSIDIPLS
jgi:signal transduction histidine kinase